MPSSDWNTASVHQKQPPAKMAVSRVMASILVGGEWNIPKIGCAASYSKGGGASISGGCSGRPSLRAAAMVAASASSAATRSRHGGVDWETVGEGKGV